MELKYEDFMLDSVKELSAVFDRFGMQSAAANLEPLQPRNKSYDENWDSDERRRIISWMDPVYTKLGYTTP